MSSGEIRVNFYKMELAAEDVRTCHNALVAQKADLEQFLAPLISTWHGVAAENWNAVQQKWDQRAQDVYTILFNLYNALDSSHQNYKSVQKAIADSWTM